jgi:hypothetical protein
MPHLGKKMAQIYFSGGCTLAYGRNVLTASFPKKKKKERC